MRAHPAQLVPVVAASLCMQTTAHAVQQSLAPRQNVAVLLFEGVQIIDYSAPYEVFSQAGVYNIYTVAETLEPLGTSGGPGAARVVPKYSFSDHPKPDILIVPGGGGSQPGDRGVGKQRENPALIRWIQEQSRDAKTVLSVCNGAFLLASAGLLEGKEATTFWGMLEYLTEVAPNARVVGDRRYVDNGKVITTAGLSSGIDGSLYVLSKLHGPGKAKQVALQMEYNWQPDSRFARAALADMALWRSGINQTLLMELKGRMESTEGTTRRWDQVVIVPGRSPAEVLAALDASIDTTTGWRPQPTSTNPRSLRRQWTQTDALRIRWTAALEVSPGRKDPSASMVRVKVSSEGARAST
jgi:transcriptional regulator GlxA family with amidase domain